MNRMLITMLVMYVPSDHKNWDDVLPFIAYAYNIAQHEATGYSPYHLLCVHATRSCLDIICSFSLHNEPSFTTTLCLVEKACRLARLRILASQECFKHCYDICRQHACYVAGDLVRLWMPLPNTSGAPVTLHCPFCCARAHEWLELHHTVSY